MPVAVMGRALGIYWFMELNMGHLILQRKAGERIAIGDDIVLSVVEIKGNRVRIAITAPNDIRVHREEIYNKIKESTTEDCSLAVAIAGVLAAKEGGA